MPLQNNFLLASSRRPLNYFPRARHISKGINIVWNFKLIFFFSSCIITMLSHFAILLEYIQELSTGRNVQTSFETSCFMLTSVYMYLHFFISLRFLLKLMLLLLFLKSRFFDAHLGQSLHRPECKCCFSANRCQYLALLDFHIIRHPCFPSPPVKILYLQWVMLLWYHIISSL